MALHIRIHPDNPQARLLEQAAEVLRNDGVIVYPTDSVYAIGCSMLSRKGLEQIARIKQVDPSKALLSFVCHDLSNLSHYANQLPNPVFRLLKHYLPGPFTFILPVSKQVPRLMQSKKSTIGLRVPDNRIATGLAAQLGIPILSASVPVEDPEVLADPELLLEQFDKLVDLVIDGGMGGIEPSTVVDLTGDEPAVVRQGKGDWLG